MQCSSHTPAARLQAGASSACAPLGSARWLARANGARQQPHAPGRLAELPAPVPFSSACGQQAFRAAGRPARRAAVRVQAQTADKLTVAITGATGLVGSRLAAKLASQGNRVRVISRDVNRARAQLQYPGLQFYSTNQLAEAVAGADAVVNLAGEPIATRWSPEIKRELKRSRVDTTSRLAAAISRAPEASRPKVFVSSSAVGYYGSSQTASFSESSPPGSDYLAEICQAWEAAAQQVPPGVRVVLVRTGIVLAREGGVLGRMLPIFELFAGGPLGTGKQWVSWVHRDDLVALIIDAIRNPSYSGAYNGTAPKPATMAQLCSAVGGVLGRPSWLPVPDFALTTLLGEGAQVVLEGQKVLPTRAQQEGFQFKYSELPDALANLLK